MVTVKEIILLKKIYDTMHQNVHEFIYMDY